MFSIIYMIRIRFFGPRELIQRYFRAARYETNQTSFVPRGLFQTPGDFSQAAIRYRDNVVLVADAAEKMMSETIQGLESTAGTVGAEKTHCTNFPRRMEKCCLEVDGELVMCVWGEESWIGRKREVCHRIPHGPGKHMFWKVERDSAGSMDHNLEITEDVAADGLTDLFVELEHTDDAEGRER